MPDKIRKVTAVDVFLETKNTRDYVGQLTRENGNFIFTYDDAYMQRSHAIPLGPDLSLLIKKHSSTDLFPTFEDRIPSLQNPAYVEYCVMVNIDPTESDPLTLIATLGRKGPSSFICVPGHKKE